jgi:hypothetical protein
MIPHKEKIIPSLLQRKRGKRSHRTVPKEMHFLAASLIGTTPRRDDRRAPAARPVVRLFPSRPRATSPRGMAPAPE